MMATLSWSFVGGAVGGPGAAPVRRGRGGLGPGDQGDEAGR